MSLPKVFFSDKARRMRGSYYKYYHLLKNHCEEVDSEEEADVVFLGMEFSRTPEKPYLLNLNDVTSLRRFGSFTPKELYKMTQAASIVMPSLYLRDRLSEHWPKIADKCTVVPIMPLKKDVEWQPLPKDVNPSVAYCGIVTAAMSSPPGFRSRDYLDTFEEIRNEGIDVHIFAPPSLAIETAQKMGCFYHGFWPQDTLYQQMSVAHAGLCGYMEDYGYGAIAQPNKTWEYLGAGIPTIGFAYTYNAEKEYLPGGWGITKDVDESWTEALARATALDITQEMVYNHTIDQYEDLIAQALETACR